jgi:hypothetical protein
MLFLLYTMVLGWNCESDIQEIRDKKLYLINIKQILISMIIMNFLIPEKQRITKYNPKQQR